MIFYVFSFLFGYVLMAFEMLGSRYLYPYFGSGLNTWAALISVVLFALMVGYFFGGQLADIMPDQRVLAGILFLASAYLLLIPTLADNSFIYIIDFFGDGVGGALAASTVLLATPLILLSVLSPFAVRLLVQDREHAGRTSGLVYAVSTLGNIAGVLITSLYLIPLMGTRAINLMLGAVSIILSVLLFFVPRLRW